MVWTMDMEFTPRAPHFEFDDAPTSMAMWGFSFGGGTRWDDPSRLPTSATQTDTKKLADVFSMPGLNAVSSRYKAIVEELEPGIHQFFPLALKARDGISYKEDYFIFKACQWRECVLLAGEDVGWGEIRSDDEFGRPFPAQFRNRLRVSQPATEGLHLWTSKFVSSKLFVSDALHRRLVKEKLRYLHFEAAEESDKMWVAENEIKPMLEWWDSHSKEHVLSMAPDWIARHQPRWLHSR